MEWQTTNDHEEIKAWVKKYSGFPAIVSGTTGEGGSGVVTIKFGNSEQDVRRISWEEFFDFFDSRNLALRYRLNDEGMPDYTFINTDKNVVNTEDHTTNVVFREEYEENVFPSARDHDK